LGSVSVKLDGGPSGSFDVQPARRAASPNDNTAMVRRGSNSVQKSMFDFSGIIRFHKLKHYPEVYLIGTPAGRIHSQSSCVLCFLGNT